MNMSPTKILQDLIGYISSENTELTYFGKDGNTRGLLSGFAEIISDIWYNLQEVKRYSNVQRAENEDLDELGLRKGIPRLGACKSSTIVLINGPKDTIIPSGKVIKSNVSDVKFITKSEIILGQRNDKITRPVYSNWLGDIVLAECIVSGSIGNVGLNELTNFEEAIPDVTVTNLVPAINGRDQETDDQYRIRQMEMINLLALGTREFYSSLTKSVNENVLLVFPTFDYTNSGTKLFVVKNSLASFTDDELNSIAELVQEKQRACSPVKVENAPLKSIEISAYIRTKEGSNFEEVYSQIAADIANYMDVEKIRFGGKILFYEIVSIITRNDNVEYFDTTTLKINQEQKDVTCLANEIARFSLLKLRNQYLDKEEIIHQSYVIPN